MWRATLTSLLAHKLRLAMTTLAIVLGVAFVSGTMIYTDTARSSFDAVFGSVMSTVDLNVRGVSQLTDAADGGFGGAAPAVPPAVVDRIAAVEGVAAVEPQVEGGVQLLDRDGEPVGGQGAPVMGINAPSVDELSPIELRSGRVPAAAGEIALDAGTARDHGFAVGDTVRLSAGGPLAPHEVVGVFGLGDDLDSMAGATITMFDPDTAFGLFNRDGGYAGVDVLAADGVDAEALGDRVEAAAGDGYEVVTGDALAAEAGAFVDTIMAQLRMALLIFAGVSLLVGAFLINNTFSIVVAQRSRELALLRAVGASRRQVLSSVLLEALVVGTLGSVAGVALGVAVATGLQGMLTAFGIDLPSATLVLAARTVLLSLVVGVGITVASALSPATSALRVPPVAALQAVPVAVTARPGRVRTAVGLLLSVAGVALLAAGLFFDAGLPATVAGALALLFGAALLARYVAAPLLRLLGGPVGRLGVRGELARENAIRNPRRTAATASALMIGLGLVVFALIFGASLRESFTQSIDEQFASQLQVGSANFQPLPEAVADLLAELPEAATVTDVRLGQVGIDGRVVDATVVEPSKMTAAWNLEVVDGSLDDLGAGGVALSDDRADELGVTAGDTLSVTFAETGAQTLPVRAVLDNETAGLYMAERTYLDNATDDGPFRVYVSVADGVALADARAAVEGVTGQFGAVTVQDSEDLREELAGQVNQFLGLTSALLRLSIVIALFGIANTLSLSVLERLREFGLLRAVGASRGQIRSMVRWESVLIAVLGAVFGVAVGTVFGWMTVRALAQDGVTAFAFPVVQVVLGVAGAAVAGTLAAIVPARRAARVDILRAVAAN